MTGPELRWIGEPRVAARVVERRFDLALADREVPGLLFTPDAPSAPRPLVLLGHGFQTSKRSSFLVPVARALVARHGLIAAALDAPGPGDREPDGGRDLLRVDRDWRAHWRGHAAAEIAIEHSAAIDVLQARPAVRAGPVGYWGLSLGTQFGLGVVASEPRIAAAVFGLATLSGPRVGAYARRVRCPVFFVLQQQDELWSPERVRELYARIASDEKQLVESPGGHEAVPREVVEASLAFLARQLGAQRAGGPGPHATVGARARQPGGGEHE